MKNILKFFRKDEIGEPPWDYNFLCNLKESEYPIYLEKIFNYRTGEKLPLRHGVIEKRRCKTFNQKIQWIKLYGVTSLMRNCTDKVNVREYVREKIGEKYLKPVLQIIPNESHETIRCHCEQANNHLMSAWQSTNRCNDTPDCRGTQNVVVPNNDGKIEDITAYFDKINWDKLPNSFVIKTNHGCKWQYIIKNKEEYIKNKRLFDIVKKNTTGWLEQDYSFWEGFELNYHGIKPKILIEPLVRENINQQNKAIQVYCFNDMQYIIKFHMNNTISLWDCNLKEIENIFDFNELNIKINADKLVEQALNLSKKLSKDFNFVRCDWMLYQNKLYFEEMTFTPYSGFYKFFNKHTNIQLGEYIK